jgi:hypothetical protein
MVAPADPVADLSLTQAAPIVRPGMHPATLTRWILAGVPLPDGSRLKLRAVRVGAKWMTRQDWIQEFIAAQTTAYTGQPDTSPAGRPSITKPNAAAARAEAELLRMGA